MRTAVEEPLFAAFYSSETAGFLMAGEDGGGKYLPPDALTEVTSLGGQGTKIRSDVRAVSVYQPGQPLHAVTSKRVIPLDVRKLDAVLTKPRRLLTLDAGETLTHLLTL